VVQITFTSQMANIAVPQLHGIDLSFDANLLFRPPTEENMYLGLVISREFIRMLGSELRCETTGDGKLQLQFDLQLDSPSKDLNGHIIRDNQSNRGHLMENPSEIKILIAEDNPLNLQIAQTMLKRLGFQPVAARNGLEVVSKLSTAHYDIILMARVPVLRLGLVSCRQQDCDMPLCNGFDATKHIRTIMKNTSIIIVALTADCTNEAKNKCIAAGMVRGRLRFPHDALC
jgi:CheY-like chemotaxis protein